MHDHTQPPPFNVGRRVPEPISMAETLTLRDQFAMAALTSIPACGNTAKEVAAWAYEIADHMLEARKEKKDV